ncbi:SDR family oxidoreductase [Streptomyces sp. C10-9-1]|uniref:SDR family NAD(P)-dependent oxidoreductase n=1 Tax=Streptomyces sp. C10-9-1 TaxID=1859285 RepID=UPI002112D409|nr:SDR family oxidoreductase [Streptomyces sp. C10-9-1]MCQ6556755.1 SDR family oxidoreductase [Streptomyces sp. C10-9-1]
MTTRTEGIDRTGPSGRQGTARGVVVTGGGTGIGRATARAFAERGDRVLVVGRTEATLAEAAGGHPGIRCLVADVTAPDAPGRIVGAALDVLGRLDVLVNNAAAMGYRPLAALDRAEAERQLHTNLLAPVLLTRAALEPLAERSGTVVNIGSAGAIGLRSWPDNGLYGAAKAALDFLTRTWAVELAPRGVRVVGLAPGVTDVSGQSGPGGKAAAPEYAAFLKEIAGRAPSGRVGRPEEMAWWILQLTRPEAAYANGTVVTVDGGLALT